MEEMHNYKGRTYAILDFRKGGVNLNHFCAYVYLPFPKEKEYCYETFRHGKTIGIDTNHWNNEKMSIDEKREDAIKQIQEVIDEYIRDVCNE